MFRVCKLFITTLNKTFLQKSSSKNYTSLHSFIWIHESRYISNLYYFFKMTCMLVTQSCPTLWPQGLPGSSLHGILQERILEWVAIPFSRGSSQLRDQTSVSHIAGRFFTTWATKEARMMPISLRNCSNFWLSIGCPWLAFPYLKACISLPSKRPLDDWELTYLYRDHPHDQYLLAKTCDSPD